jgi:hypothetical protein
MTDDFTVEPELPPKFVRVTHTRQLHNLPPETRIKIRGKVHEMREYAGLTTGGAPLLQALASLGIPMEVEELNDPDFPVN